MSQKVIINYSLPILYVELQLSESFEDIDVISHTHIHAHIQCTLMCIHNERKQ